MRKTPFGTEMFCIRATARDCPYGTGQGNRKGLPLRNWAGQPQGIAPTELGRATARDCPYGTGQGNRKGLPLQACKTPYSEHFSCPQLQQKNAMHVIPRSALL